MAHFQERLDGERWIRQQEEAKAFKEAAEKVFGDTVLVQPDPNAHLGAVEDE